MNQENIAHVEEETEKVPLPAIFGLTIAVMGLLIVTVLLSFYGMQGAITNEKISKSITEGSRTLNQLNEEEQAISQEYRELGNGKYRVPIEKAMELVVEEND